MNLPTRGPRGEAYFTGHVCRKIGAEAFTAAGIKVPVAQIFGRWGKTMILRYCQEAPLASSSQIAAKLRRPAYSALAPQDVEELELLKATVARLASKLEGREDEYSRNALQELQRLEEASDEEACEVPSGARPCRPPFDLATARKVVNFDFDRHSVANRGLVGVVHAAKIYGAEVPQALWKARCGWRFGRKACEDGKAWRFLVAHEDLAPYGVCDRCAAP